jgi:hypothetical protein
MEAFLQNFGGKTGPFCGCTEKHGGGRMVSLLLAGPPGGTHPPFIYFPGTRVAAP